MSTPEGKPIDPETVEKQLKKAQDEGIVDLDQPLRKAIPQIEKIIRRVQREPDGARSGYCVVGDAGWLSKPPTDV
jgi:hypothetical protein